MCKTKYKKILIIAYAFPPHSVVGSMRPLRFVKYLKKVTEWEPVVLTVRKKFKRTDPTLVKEIPADVPIYSAPVVEPRFFIEGLFRKKANRTAGSKSANLLGSDKNDNPFRNNRKRSVIAGIKRLVLDSLSTPDPIVFWNLFAIPKAYRIIKKHNIRVILITSPPWSMQISGWVLKRLLDVSWIADLRDPWADVKRFNRAKIVEKIDGWLERNTLARADLVLSSSESFTETLKRKFSDQKSDRFKTLVNGFDETKFQGLNGQPYQKFTIVHLGTIYPEFDPFFVFSAIGDWLKKSIVCKDEVQIKFIGVIDETIKQVLKQNGLEKITEVTGFVEHRIALDICSRADLLLLLTGMNRIAPKGMIQAKLFEYIALNRPILGCILDGDAAKIIRNTKSGFVVSSKRKKEVENVLEKLFRMKKNSTQNMIEWSNDAGRVAAFKQVNLIKSLGKYIEEATRFE